MFSSAVNIVNSASGIGKTSCTYSVNKVMNVKTLEHSVQEDPTGPTFNVAPGAVKVPTATSKKGKFP